MFGKTPILSLSLSLSHTHTHTPLTIGVMWECLGLTSLLWSGSAPLIWMFWKSRSKLQTSEMPRSHTFYTHHTTARSVPFRWFPPTNPTPALFKCGSSTSPLCSSEVCAPTGTSSFSFSPISLLLLLFRVISFVWFCFYSNFASHFCEFTFWGFCNLHLMWSKDVIVFKRLGLHSDAFCRPSKNILHCRINKWWSYPVSAASMWTPVVQEYRFIDASLSLSTLMLRVCVKLSTVSPSYYSFFFFRSLLPSSGC